MKIHTPVLDEYEKAVQAGLREIGKVTLAASNARAPKDDLDLVKSGQVRVDDLTSQVSYTAPHAPLQHEHLDWEHPDGGEAKFLESAALEVDVEGIMAKHTRAALDG